MRTCRWTARRAWRSAPTGVREERCSPTLSVDPSSGCRGSFRAPSLDNQVNIRSTGILGRRIHVNVDFDTEREYTSNNDIQIYYEGLEDEIVRRVDVGTVTFQPPSSRFITAAVPANNFGVNAIFDFGPIELQTLAATQKGSVVAERTYTIGQTTSQAQDRQARDLDFESGRFFWVVDPDSVPGTPAVDILELDPTAVPATYRPTEVRVYRYRAARGNSGVNPNLGGITASARPRRHPQPFPAVRWELLIQGSDYYLDASGLWIVLATKLDQNDYLAVSFRTAAGGTVGTFPEVDQGAASTDVLEMIAEPQQTQDRCGPSATRCGTCTASRLRPRPRLAPGRHHAQPLRAADRRDRGDLPPAARPRRSERRHALRPGQPALAARARPRGGAGGG